MHTRCAAHLLPCTAAAMRMTRCAAHLLRCAPGAMRMSHWPCTDLLGLAFRMGKRTSRCITYSLLAPWFFGSSEAPSCCSGCCHAHALHCLRHAGAAGPAGAPFCSALILLTCCPHFTRPCPQHAGAAGPASCPLCSALASAHLLPTLHPSLLQHAGAARPASTGGGARRRGPPGALACLHCQANSKWVAPGLRPASQRRRWRPCVAFFDLCVPIHMTSFLSCVYQAAWHDFILASQQVFGGGPVLTANPEPYADFFDVVLLGE